jgi:hypothetical protein
MSEYQFTKDWFSWAPQVWEQLIPMLPERKAFLEIGSFEGRSTVWIIENMLELGGFIDCVDTWEGGEEHSAEDMGGVEARFDHNVKKALDTNYIRPDNYSEGYALRPICFINGHDYSYSHRVYKYKAKSTELLGKQLCDPVVKKVPLYDFIYIDGSHIAKDVLTDACMAWPLLKPKGIMVFDDYMWGNPRDILHRPKPAIDAFCNIFAEEVDIVHVGYQLIVRKKEGAN